jgi:hypothetical protein
MSEETENTAPIEKRTTTTADQTIDKAIKFLDMYIQTLDEWSNQSEDPRKAEFAKAFREEINRRMHSE